MKKIKKRPVFKSEAEEKKFWKVKDSAEYRDWSKAKKVSFPNLQPSVKVISIRLPEALLNQLKILAHKRNVPYQSLIKILLSEKVRDEFAA